MQTLGVKALRVELYWADVAPGADSATKPGFDATNPGSYAWGEYDALIAEAQRLHWKVLLTVTSPVPRWATSNKKAPYVTDPDPKDFEEFMTAVARHYGRQVVRCTRSGTSPTTPPSCSRSSTPTARPPRRASTAASTRPATPGCRPAGIASPKVLIGETAPTGYDTVNVQARKSARRCCTTSRRCCSCAKRCA